MCKAIRIFKKQEKRIVKLLYKKGLIDIDLKELYWSEYKPYKSRRRRGKTEYSFQRSYPEVHFSQVDYWGECDEFGLVDKVLEELYWDNVEKENMPDFDYPESKFKYKGRQWFIEYLSKLPTVKFDSKINQVLNMGYNF